MHLRRQFCVATGRLVPNQCMEVKLWLRSDVFFFSPVNRSGLGFHLLFDLQDFSAQSSVVFNHRIIGQLCKANSHDEHDPFAPWRGSFGVSFGEFGSNVFHPQILHNHICVS